MELHLPVPVLFGGFPPKSKLLIPHNSEEKKYVNKIIVNDIFDRWYYIKTADSDTVLKRPSLEWGRDFWCLV